MPKNKSPLNQAENFQTCTHIGYTWGQFIGPVNRDSRIAIKTSLPRRLHVPLFSKDYYLNVFQPVRRVWGSPPSGRVCEPDNVIKTTPLFGAVTFCERVLV